MNIGKLVKNWDRDWTIDSVNYFFVIFSTSGNSGGRTRTLNLGMME
jgi:hypothetical protein